MDYPEVAREQPRARRFRPGFELSSRSLELKSTLFARSAPPCAALPTLPGSASAVLPSCRDRWCKFVFFSNFMLRKVKCVVVGKFTKQNCPIVIRTTVALGIVPNDCQLTWSEFERLSNLCFSSYSCSSFSGFEPRCVHCSIQLLLCSFSPFFFLVMYVRTHNKVKISSYAC